MGSTLEYLRNDKRDEILKLAEQHGVEDVRVFGSVVRGEDRPNSDIDFLITLKKGGGIDEWFSFWDEMELLLDRELDVFQPQNLRWQMKSRVLAEAQPL